MRPKDSSWGQTHLLGDWKARVTKVSESPTHQRFCIPDSLLKMNVCTSKQEEQLGHKPSTEIEEVPSRFILMRTCKKRKQISQVILFSEEEFHDIGKTVIHYITSNKENTGCHEMQAKAR